MTDKEFFIYTVADELPRCERVFKAVPKGKAKWKPHAKSRTAGELAVAMAVECATFPVFLKTGVVDFAEVYKNAPKNTASALKMLVRGLKSSVTVAKKMSQKQWGSKAEMKSGKKVEWSTTRGKMAWALLLDLVHHRGQLSVYLRPMGGKVPSIYGPSGDSK